MKPGIYSYADLVGKIQVGDIVRAVPGKTNPCSEINNDGSNTAKITNVEQNTFRINGCLHGSQSDYFLEVLPSAVSPVDQMTESLPTFLILENRTRLCGTAATASKARSDAARILAENASVNLSIIEVKHSWTVERVVTAKLHKQ